MESQWNFPGNGNGQIRGFSDAGIETYGGNELQALARETCQNSLDAIRDNETEVRVEFERHYINSSDMPGYKAYANVLKKCQNFWSGTKSEKAIAYLKTAVRAINESKLYVLRISDYNTTGLLGPYDDRFDGWNALTKIDGGATKSGDKAGSFGIGKNAPFCNSYYRLVFYRTLNDDGEKAAQGISRLLSFPEDSKNAMNSMTTGIGYFGNSINNRPVESILSLDSLSLRKEKGTDVFVYGFSGIGDGWIDNMCSEILENFMMSIYNGKLSVIIEHYHLNSNTLGDYVEKYRAKLKQAYCFYLALDRKNDVKEYAIDFHGLGTLNLRVLVDQNEKLNRKIMITRTSGMKLFNLGNISRAISFTGILEMRGRKLNEYFREMETPAHDEWRPSRHHNPVEAKEYFDELKEWIREIVLSLGEYTSDEEIEVEGLSGILQNESELDHKKSEDDKKETLNNNLGEIIVTHRSSQEKTTKGLFFGSDGVGQAETKDVPGTINPGGREPTTRKLSGTRTRSKRDYHVGIPDPDGNDTVHKSSGGEKNCPLENVRIVKISNNNFRVNFSLPHNIFSGHAEILAVGENGKPSRLKILEAEALSGCIDIHAASQRINFSSMSGNEKVSFKFSLIDNKEYAMEVNVYEHN